MDPIAQVTGLKSANHPDSADHNRFRVGLPALLSLSQDAIRQRIETFEREMAETVELIDRFGRRLQLKSSAFRFDP